MKKTVKGFVHMSTNSWNPGELVMYGCDMSNCIIGAVLVKEIDVEVEMPAICVRGLQISALRAKNKQAAADFHALQTDIMRQINELQALEMTA